MTPPPTLPPNHPCFNVFVDESGVGAQSKIFAMGAMSIHSADDLLASVEQVLTRTCWQEEIRFSEIRKSNLHRYEQVIDEIVTSGARFNVDIIDRRTQRTNAFRHQRYLNREWMLRCQMVIGLVERAIPQHGIGGVFIDRFDVPVDSVNPEGYITMAINNTRGHRAVHSTLRMKAKSSLGLQLVDLVTGAVAYQHRADIGERTGANPKAQIASYLQERLNLASLVWANSPRLRVKPFQSSRSSSNVRSLPGRANQIQAS